MNRTLLTELIVTLLPSLMALTFSLFSIGSARLRRIVGVISSAAVAGFFVYHAFIEGSGGPARIVPGWPELSQTGAYCGALFNFMYVATFVAFGDRVFTSRTAGLWIIVQLCVSVGILCENTELFALVLTLALIVHLMVSQTDVYQVSRRQDRFLVVVFSSILAVILSTVFFFCVTLALNGYSSFRIFGESFYGDSAKSFRKMFQPLVREKIAVSAILIFLFVSGLVGR